jgi:prevent-host-death family protein
MMTIFVDQPKAKAQFAFLLDRAAKGHEIVIMRHGKPVARFVGVQPNDLSRVNEAACRLKRLRKTPTLGGFSWEAFRDAGRR